MTQVRIATNNKGDGDWVYVMRDEDIVYSGHSIGANGLFEVLIGCNGFEYIEIYSLTNEQLDRFPECIWEDDILPTKRRMY